MATSAQEALYAPDPLIAEAKERRRRRRLLAVAAFVAVAAAAVAAIKVELPTSTAPATVSGQSDSSAGGPQAPVTSVTNSGGVTSVVTRAGANRHYQLWLSATGGRTWLKAAAPQQLLVDGASPNFVDSRHGWLSGLRDDGRWELYRTTDGGRTWQAVTLPRSGPWQPGSFKFFDARHGYFFAGTSLGTTLFSTSDGGTTWQRVWGPSRTAYAGGLFLDRQHAIVGDLNGDMPYDAGAFSLYRTSDAGRTGTPVRLGGRQTHFAGTQRYSGVVGGMASVGGTFLIAAQRQDGRNLVYTSSDRGVHWRAHPVPSQAWLVGTGQDAKVFPPLFSAVSPTTWVTTDMTRQRLFMTTDAGRRWLVTTLPRSFQFAPTIAFTSAHVGWALAGNGELLRTTDGGRHWNHVTKRPRRARP